jgi:aryl-alcohol dehydrogenase-like predicted oxidoreductase
MKRTLGSGPSLAPIGLGCMGLSEFYGAPTEENAAIGLLHEAIDLGVDHFDTAEIYGPHTNETLLGKAFKDKRDKVFIATKFGPRRDPETGQAIGLDGSRENCRRSIEGSLKRLKTDAVDLYYIHRIDKKTPIEETVGAMAELVTEGKVKAIGLSEASAETIRRAAAVHPITTVQSEYSIFSRDIEDSVMPAIKEVGASLVAYSPLGRGMLAGAFSKHNQPQGTDYRASSQPRFQGDAYAANLALAKKIETIAARQESTPSQISLAWILAQGDHIHTIPGTTKLKNLKANLGSYGISLSKGDMTSLSALADQVKGARYNKVGMAVLDP